MGNLWSSTVTPEIATRKFSRCWFERSFSNGRQAMSFLSSNPLSPGCHVTHGQSWSSLWPEMTLWNEIQPTPTPTPTRCPVYLPEPPTPTAFPVLPSHWSLPTVQDALVPGHWTGYSPIASYFLVCYPAQRNIKWNWWSPDLPQREFIYFMLLTDYPLITPNPSQASLMYLLCESWHWATSNNSPTLQPWPLWGHLKRDWARWEGRLFPLSCATLAHTASLWKHLCLCYLVCVPAQSLLHCFKSNSSEASVLGEWERGGQTSVVLGWGAGGKNQWG